ncbi:MAG: DUF3108 domain-containing protein [Acidobacteriota bacterium]
MNRISVFYFSCFSFFVFLAPPPVSAQPAHVKSGQPVPFAVGETLTYDVSWSSFVSAGQATLSVQERTSAAGASTYHIVADGRPTPLVSSLYTLYYKVESWLDTSNLLPRRASTYTEEGRRRRSTSVTFDQRAHKAVYDAGGTRRSFTIPPLTQDALAALYVLRALHVASGAQLTMPVVNNGELHHVTLTAGSRDTVECGLGAVQATRVDFQATDSKGEPVGRNMAVWLTGGRRQVPVQIRAELAVGSFRLVLRDAHGLRQ